MRRASSARHGERGQALLFALLALLIASIAAAFVAEDILLRERAMQEEAARQHVRALLDGALADALARLADHRSLEVEPQSWGGGRTDVDRIAGENETLIYLRVHAEYAARRGAVEARVLLFPVTVLSWRRIHPG